MLSVQSCTMLQAIFAEAPTVHDRLADVSALSDQLCLTLDVNDQMTVRQSVKHITDRLTEVIGAAEDREKALIGSLEGWTAFQV